MRQRSFYFRGFVFFAPSTHQTSTTVDSRYNAENFKQRYYPAQQRKQRPKTPRVCGVLLWLVALSEAAILHPSSSPLCLVLCCSCASGASRAAKKNNTWYLVYIFRKTSSNAHDAGLWTCGSSILAGIVFFFSAFFVELHFCTMHVIK